MRFLVLPVSHAHVISFPSCLSSHTSGHVAPATDCTNSHLCPRTHARTKFPVLRSFTPSKRPEFDFLQSKIFIFSAVIFMQLVGFSLSSISRVPVPRFLGSGDSCTKVKILLHLVSKIRKCEAFHTTPLYYAPVLGLEGELPLA
jgi:hypothetical protein